jgi:hypothetical protein
LSAIVSEEPSTREPVRPDALRRLEERLHRASAAAERLMAEAAGGGAAGAGGAADAAGAGGPAGATGAPESSRASGATVGPESSRVAGSGGREPPPAGWQSPAGEASSDRDGDLDALVLLRSLRDLIPPELQQRLFEALREVLKAIRALIDWYLERLEHSRDESAEVQDIPIL